MTHCKIQLNDTNLIDLKEGKTIIVHIELLPPVSEKVATTPETGSVEEE